MPRVMQSSYARVFALPSVRSTFGLSLVGRFAYALVYLPLFYAAERSASVAVAGSAVGLYGAGASFLAPARAWFIDRYGARRPLNVLVVAFGVTLCLMAGAGLMDGAAWLLLVLAGVAGAVAPPLGPTMRVAWAQLAPEDELLKKGLSADASVEELLYLLGPAVSGFLLGVLSPGQALLIPALLVVAGGLVFVNSPAIVAMRPSIAPCDVASHGRSLLLSPRFVAILLPALVAGAVSATISVAVPVLVEDLGGPQVAGIALGVFAGGSAVGGLLYGLLTLPGRPVTHLPLICSILIGVAMLVPLTTGTVPLIVVLAVAGLFFSPVMVVAYIAANSASGKWQQNAATTWVNTSHNLGSAAASAGVGIVIQQTSVSLGVTLAGVLAACLVGISVVLNVGKSRPNTEPDLSRMG